MTDDELRAVSARWDEFETIGSMPDGAPIKKIGVRMTAVREPSGYFCSPIAYSCRLETGAREWFTPKWVTPSG
jgi:hypothetical protein